MDHYVEPLLALDIDRSKDCQKGLTEEAFDIADRNGDSAITTKSIGKSLRAWALGRDS